jgi:Bacteriophage tail sheath protein
MTVSPTYPGVYIEEIPSGVRTITGVATSITAFIGAAGRGPVNQAVTINGFGDFESQFGGLWLPSTLGFAVRDFFLNGGSQAVIVRLYGDDSTKGTYAINIGDFKFLASSPGKWGASLRVNVDLDNISDDVAKGMGLTKSDLFNLTVRDTATGVTEKFLNLSVKNGPRRVDKVLESESELLRYSGAPDPTKAPKAGMDDLSTKEKTWIDAKEALITLQNAKPDDAGIPAAKQTVTTTKQAFDDAATKAAGDLGDGTPLKPIHFLPQDGFTTKSGLYALEGVDLFNLLCIPPYSGSPDPTDVDVNVVSAAAAYCEKRRAMLLVDAPSDWKTKKDARDKFIDPDDKVGTRSRNASLYFPRLRQPNPLRDNQMEVFANCGAIAGIFARTDSQRGVWKAPAGQDATLVGVPSLAVPLTDGENGELNPLGINCLRAFPLTGRVVWGARTLRGADQLADEYKYVPVRRTALYIEESLYRGLKWVVFEPNDEPLWAQIRLNAGAFMHDLFRQGAFQGQTPKDAYFVKCDKETTTQTDIDHGIVNIIVGFAPLKPAEFVIVKIQQIAGQIET